VAAGIAGPALAQQSGQWSWDGRFGAWGQSVDNRLDGRQTSTLNTAALDLGLGLKGFIVHPALARFQVGAEFLFTDTDTGVSNDSRGLGGGASLDILPIGAYRTSLYASHRNYTYLDIDDPYLSRGLADVTTRYGGRFSARRGFFSGLLLGYDVVGIDFLNPNSRRESLDRGLFDWSKKIDGVSNHLRVENQRREYGLVDLDFENLTVNLDERAQISANWSWELYGTGVRVRRGTSADAFENERYQVRTRFRRTMAVQDLLDLVYVYGKLRPDLLPDIDSHTASVLYRWRPRPAWELAPLVRYITQSGGDEEELESLRTGLQVVWRQSYRYVDPSIASTVTYGSVDGAGPEGSTDQGLLAASFSGTIGHGKALGGLRKELTVNVARNELNLTRTQDVTAPDLVLHPGGLSVDNLGRVRLTLRHRWDGRQLTGWIEAYHRDVTDVDVAENYTVNTTLGSLQFSSRRFTVVGDLQDSQVSREINGDQGVRSGGLSARWRPWRTVALRGNYRLDRRDIHLAPKLDIQRIEAGVLLTIGQFYVDAGVYQIDDELVTGGQRVNRGVRWSVSRRFGGWLPIHTGTRPRGVIR
jgi:hypothetical protein